jgi:AraC family transcriptional regulator
MNESWIVPLGRPPVLRRVGVGIHGERREERYRLPEFWCLHCYEYACELTVGGTRLNILPGDVTLVPPDRPITYRYPRGGRRHLYGHFALADAGPQVAIPCHVRLPRREHRDFQSLFNNAVAEQVLGPERVAAALWELLWRLAALPTVADNAPELQAAKLIDGGLARAPTVRHLAAEVGVSADHLTRRFRARFGSSVKGYISERRLALARDLLLTTDLPVAQVAKDCGLPDLHYFNKLIRGRWGLSPRAVRAGRGS